MTRFKYNKVLLVVMLAALLAALMIVWQRHGAEESNKRAELVMDYEDIVELARTEGEPVSDLMTRFREAGVTTLAVYDTTLEKLHRDGRVTVLAGTDIQERLRAGTPVSISQGGFQSDKVYVIGKNRPEPDKTYDEVRSDLIRRLGAARVQELPDQGRRILEVSGNYEKLIKWNLGISSEEIKESAAYGFWVMIRPTNYTKVTADDVESVFSRLDGVDKISGMMFVGDEVLGYPGLLPLTAQELKKHNMTLAMIEHPLQLQFLRQEGLTQLATLLQYQAARVYVIPKDEQLKLKLAEAIQRWGVTEQERNIRVNLLRKYDKAEGNRTVLETNLAYVQGVKTELAGKGFQFGRASVLPPYFPASWLLALVIMGAVAAGVLFLSLVYPFPVRWQYVLLVVLSAALIFPVLKGGGTLARQMAALASAVIIPALAMTWQLDRWRSLAIPEAPSLGRILLGGLGNVTLIMLLSLVGGLYVAALLGDVRFFLEMEIYRGVKVTFVMPLVLITITYLTRYQLLGEPVTSVNDFWNKTVRFLNYPLQVKTLLIAGVAAVAAWMFIGRSGHTLGVPVSETELRLRAFLEQVMSARPRGKEAFIGHPAFFLAVMAVWQRWPQALHYVLVVAATIAMGSLVETFAHLRTPVMMSVERAFNGLAVGAVCGIAAVIGVWLLQSLSRALGRRITSHE